MTPEDAEMVQDTVLPRRRLPGRVARWAIGIAVVLLIALLGLWIERKPLASDYVNGILAKKGVPARYTIADLGFGRQRLTNVSIGDPAHPDLVADWIELRTSVGFGGAAVTGIAAGHVRMRARLIDGHVSLGTIDKLLPPPSGKPFALPSLYADLQDVRMRLEAPQGAVGLKLSGSGKLDDGFIGDLAAVSRILRLPGCDVQGVSSVVRVSISDRQPTISGPVRAGSIACGANVVRYAAADVTATLGEALDRWQGSARLKLAMVTTPQARVANVVGTVTSDGSIQKMTGNAALASGAFSANGIGGASLGLSGKYALAGGAPAFIGRVGAGGAHVSPALLAPLASGERRAQGSPIGPLAAALARAASRAAANFDLDGDIAVDGSGGITVSRLIANAASGARATLNGGEGLYYDATGLRIDGALALTGGGLPDATIRLAQAASGAPLVGNATVAPYTAGGARLALTPVQFRATPGGRTSFFTTATLTGPLGDGHVDNVSLPLAGLWDGHGLIALNPSCAPLTFDSLASAGVVLGRTRLNLCPLGTSLVRVDSGRLSGGARIAALQLNGRLGSTPLSVVGAGATLRLGDTGFDVSKLAVRLGAPERVTRLDFAQLGGKLAGGSITGAFTGGGGQIANVPLLLSGATADWSLKGGKLAVGGAMTVSDADTNPRFKPLAAHDVVLALANNRIDAKGVLVTPTKNVKVADVTIVHDLGQGAGHADLAVPGITFTKEFQPEELTRLTFGVIADVRGGVSGAGHIAWSPDAVTSNGDFTTVNTDLAAAFGPVAGIAGTIHFTDLLALQSAPHQLVTIASVNPGVAVMGGEIRYQTLPNTRIQIESGHWPFAGGTLTLDPTLLDFGEAQQRQLTFRIAGMDAGQFLQQFDFANLNATGVFDGVLPMTFDIEGGRIVDGHLTVRPGGGTLAYVGDLSQKDLGFWGNMAFGALKSLKYRSLNIVMNGPLAGEMITEVHFAGVGQGVGAKRNFILDRLQKLPLIFNVTIRAPFRGLIDSAQSFYDPKRLIERNLPALLEEQNKRAAPPAAPAKPIQPQESRSVP